MAHSISSIQKETARGWIIMSVVLPEKLPWHLTPTPIAATPIAGHSLLALSTMQLRLLAGQWFQETQKVVVSLKLPVKPSQRGSQKNDTARNLPGHDAY